MSEFAEIWETETDAMLNAGAWSVESASEWENTNAAAAGWDHEEIQTQNEQWQW